MSCQRRTYTYFDVNIHCLGYTRLNGSHGTPPILQLFPFLKTRTMDSPKIKSSMIQKMHIKINLIFCIPDLGDSQLSSAKAAPDPIHKTASQMRSRETPHHQAASQAWCMATWRLLGIFNQDQLTRDYNLTLNTQE